MTTTARILQSTGLDINKSAITAREIGLTSDTERPVIGTTTGGAKYIGTEDVLNIITTAPAAVPILRRSCVRIYCDTTTAGGNIALDIRNGAEIQGYSVFILCTGGGSRKTSITYASGKVLDIWDGMSASLVWGGSAWIDAAQSAYFSQLKWDLDNLGFTGYDLYGDRYLQDKVRIARRGYIGQVLPGVLSQTPTAFPVAQSSALPSNPEYFPGVPVHDANHDVSTTQVPQWVIDKFLAEKVSLAGVRSWTATLSGGVLTFGSGTANDIFLDFMQEQGMVNRWYATGEIGLWAASGSLFTGPRQQSLTIAGVHYAIASENRSSRTITLATYPANGTVSVEFHPHAIGGSTTSFRLRRISGEALVAAGDISGEIGVGAARMHRILGHWHNEATGSSASSGDSNNPTNSYRAGYDSGGSQVLNKAARAGTNGVAIVDALGDGTNSLVSGKTNDVRTAGMAVYVNVGVLLATSWTSAA